MKIIINDQIRFYDVIRKVNESTDPSIEIIVAENSLVSKYPGNLRLVEQIGKNLGKKIMIVDDRNKETNEVDHHENDDMVAAIEKKALEVESKEPGDVPIKKIGTKNKHPKMLNVKTVLIFMLVLLLITVGGAYAFLRYYLPRATVTLYVAEKVLERSVDANVDPRVKEIDSKNFVVPGQQITVETQSSTDFNVTGKKTVGDKAHGVLDILNYAKTAILIPTGSRFKASSEDGEILEFVSTNDKTITVPAVTETMPSPGTRKLEAGRVNGGIPIEAATFGEKYNLAANTTFILVSSSVDLSPGDVTISNPSPIAGGSTRDVNAVAKEDIENAQQQLKDQAFAGVEEKLKANLQSGYSFSKSTIDNLTKFVEFNHEIGDETSVLTGTIKVQSSVIAYAEQDVMSLLTEDIKENVPTGFELSECGPTLRVEDAKAASGKLLLKAKISALVVPIIDMAVVKQEVLGESVGVAENYLKNIQQTDGFDIQITPNLPEPLRVMPYLADRLEIKVALRK